MRVVINRTVALRQKSGIGHYTAQLLRCLRAQGGDEIDPFPSGWAARACRACFRGRGSVPHGSGGQKSGPGRRSGPGLRTRFRESLRRFGQVAGGLYLKGICARRNYDLYHEPNFIPLPSDCPTVATLHDLSVLLHPEWHPRDRVAYFERNFRRGLDQCAHFLTISEFGRQEVIRTLNLPPSRVTRTYMGVRPDLGPLPDAAVRRTLRLLGLPPRYLLHVGTIEPRKNLLMLLRAYCNLPGPLRERYPLVLVGGWGWNAGPVVKYFTDVARHRGVLHVGYLPDEHLAAVYNGARALVFPSLYEGFGMPAVEMMACGGAVLASTAGAIVETAGSKADLIPAEDGDGWCKAMARVLTDGDWWHSLRQGAESAARPYTWENCAAETLRVYRFVCGERASIPAACPEQAGQRRAG